MIFTPSGETPQIVGGANERRFWDRFRLFYDPAPLVLSGTAPAAGYDLENLYGEAYAENVLWKESTVSLDGTFPAREIAAVILGDPSFAGMSGGFYLGGEEVLDLGTRFWGTDTGDLVTSDAGNRFVFGRAGGSTGLDIGRVLAPGAGTPDVTDQGIFVLLLPRIRADSFRFVFSGTGAASLSKLYVGGAEEWIPGSGTSYALEGRGSGGLTDVGTVYGTRKPSRRAFEYSWSVVDDTHRRSMERYIDTVQNCTAHFIMPFDRDGDFIPPMFVRLESQEAKNERWRGGWFWNSPSLRWDILR